MGENSSIYDEGSSGVWAPNTLHSRAFSHLFPHGVPIFSDGAACVWRCCLPPWPCERLLNQRQLATISKSIFSGQISIFLDNTPLLELSCYTVIKITRCYII